MKDDGHISSLLFKYKDWLQWLFISYAVLTSIGFLIRTYWTEFSDNLEPTKRLIAIALVCSVQIVLLVMFKFYFLSTLNAIVNREKKKLRVDSLK